MARKITTRIEMLSQMGDQSYMDVAPGEEYYKQLIRGYDKFLGGLIALIQVYQRGEVESPEKMINAIVVGINDLSQQVPLNDPLGEKNRGF